MFAYFPLMLNQDEIVNWNRFVQHTSRNIAVVRLLVAADNSRVRARIDHTVKITRGASAGQECGLGGRPHPDVRRGSDVDPVPVCSINKLKKLLVEEYK